MTDVIRQLRSYGEQLEAGIVSLEVDEVRTQHVGAGPVRPLLDRPSPSRVPRWVTVVVAAGAVLVIGLLVLIGLRERADKPVVDQPTVTTIDSAPTTSPSTPANTGVPLTPSGVEVLAYGSEFFGSVVSDASGVIWGQGPAGVLRYDPSIQETRRWTIADDAWFGPGVFADVATAREGGVWLYGSLVVHFDGTTFTQVIEAPGMGDVQALAEASDGKLWAAVNGAGLLYWNGSAWVESPVTPGADSLIAVDDLGGVWVTKATLQRASDDWHFFALVHYDGLDWVGYEMSDLGAGLSAANVSAIDALAIDPEGDPWLAMAPRGGQGPRLFNLHSGIWTTHTPPGLTTNLNPVSVVNASDGTVWASFVDDYDGDLRVAAYDGDTWTTYGPAAGLYASGWVIADLATTPDGVFLGRGSELLELVGDVWVRVLPGPESSPPGYLDVLVPLSTDESWGADWTTVWHFRDGLSEAHSPATGLPVDGIHDLALGPDDTVWVAAETGTALFEESTWSLIDTGPSSMVEAGPDGSMWVAAGSALEDNLRLVAFKRVGETWGATPIEPPPIDIIDSWALGTDGSMWVGSHGSGWTLPGRGMARYREGTWEVVDRIGASTIEMVGDIVVFPNGEVWTIVTTDGGGPFIVRYDGSEWRIDETATLPSGHSGFDANHRLWVDSTGMVYMPRTEGTHTELLAFDGTAWTVLPGEFPLIVSVAPDGSIWCWDGNLVVYPKP